MLDTFRPTYAGRLPADRFNVGVDGAINPQAHRCESAYMGAERRATRVYRERAMKVSASPSETLYLTWDSIVIQSAC
jgi:hypothetical protein